MSDIEDGAAEIIAFWREAGPDRWFFKDEAFDAEFRGRFLDRHLAAARRECDHWAENAEGALALMILLDQLPRNCFRGTGHMYAADPLARYFARKAIDAGFDMEFDPGLRAFFYLPFQHSENLDDQEFSVEMSRTRAEEQLKYALEHLDIIQRFGRFPHRNPMLGRQNTPEEQAFLDSDGFAG